MTAPLPAGEPAEPAPADTADPGVTDPAIETHAITLHGHRVSYRVGGDGPLLVLIHGIAGSSATWLEVMPRLARRYTVLAPDLLGHGESAKPRGDYSLGAYASGLRDLLAALGHERATIVGHSLGGGIAMQFAYQFPERAERLVLVASGGLGRELHLSLRAAALPGAEYVLPLLCGPWIRNVGDRVSSLLSRLGLRAASDMEEIWVGFRSLSSTEARQAFLHTVRTSIDLGGQRIDATDRIYLTRHVPTLLLWGERDPIIPAEHGRAAHELIEGSRLVTFPESGHFPHRDDPGAFAQAIDEFCRTTTPSSVQLDEWGRLLRSGDEQPPASA
jgi:pimeloyl-ACP methyl ester carboxylesterase